VDINVKLSLFTLFPNPGAANQTLPLPSTASRLLWFGLRGVGLLGWGSGDPLTFCPATSRQVAFTLASGENFARARGNFSLAGRWPP